ncbi:MAG: hypothetical protein E3J72_05730 [Planctomycetota bacterium]|nr:MAG: hypothetical protein E3J72_05730 [Planctomycetota bacterium]
MSRSTVRMAVVIAVVSALALLIPACTNRSGQNLMPFLYNWPTGSAGGGVGPTGTGTGSDTGINTDGVPRTVMIEVFDRYPSYFPNLQQIIRTKKDYDCVYANYIVYPEEDLYNWQEHRFIVLSLFRQGWPEMPYVHIDGERVGKPCPNNWDIETKIEERRAIPAEVELSLEFTPDAAARTVTVTGTVTNMWSEAFPKICLRACVYDHLTGGGWFRTSFDAVGQELTDIIVTDLGIGETKDFPAWTSKPLPAEVDFKTMGVMASAWELTGSGLGRCFQGTDVFPAGPGFDPGNGTSTDPINIEDYFWPLESDWRWTFESGDYFDVSPTVDINGVTTYPMREYSVGNPAWMRYFGTDGSATLYMYRFGVHSETYWNLETPVVWGFRGMEAGEKVTTMSKAIEHDFTTDEPTGRSDNWKFEATYLGQEPVTVPYKHCPDCIKVFYRTYRQSALYFEETYWFSQGEGIVKYHATYVNCDPKDILWETSSIQFPW